VSIEPIQLILIAIFLLVAFPVHEFAHAAVANMQGDATAKLFGRMTAQPLVHFDPVGGLMTIVSVLLGGFLFGWAKPTPVNTRTCATGATARFGRPRGPLSTWSWPCSRRSCSGCCSPRTPSCRTSSGGALPVRVFQRGAGDLQPDPDPPLDGSVLLFRLLSPRRAWSCARSSPSTASFVLIAFILLLSRPLAGVYLRVCADFLVGA